MSTTTSEGRIKLFLDNTGLTAGVTKSKDALAKMDEVLRRTGPALGDMSKASKAASLGTDLLTGGVLGAVKSFGPWGLAIGVAADAMIGYIGSTDAAAKATREYREQVENTIKSVRQMVQEQLALDTFNERHEKALSRATKEIRERERAIEDQIAETRGWGESTRDLERDLTKLRVEAMLAEAGVSHFLETEAEGEKRRAKIFAEVREIERKQELADIEERAAAEKRAAEVIKVGGKGGSKPKEKAVDLDLAGRGEYDRELLLFKQAEEQKKAMREQSERDFQNLDDRFGAIQSRRAEEEAALHDAKLARMRSLRDLEEIDNLRLRELEAEKIDLQFQFDSQIALGDQQAEQARQMRHENELARIDEEKRAREEQLGMQQKIVEAAAQYAGQAVSGLLAISDARKNARAAALAQGKSEAEAARAAKVAELQARASAMTGIRNMAAVKAAEHMALGIGALATTWGIPNPSATLHFVSAGLFGALAGAAAARADSLGSRAAGMEGGGGFGGAGFGSPGAGGQGGAANSAPSASTQPGAGNSVPGSPVPQPQAGGQSGSQGGTVVHIHGNVIGNRQFVDDLARQLDEREHRRPRRAAGGG